MCNVLFTQGTARRTVQLTVRRTVRRTVRESVHTVGCPSDRTVRRTVRRNGLSVGLSGGRSDGQSTGLSANVFSRCGYPSDNRTDEYQYNHVVTNDATTCNERSYLGYVNGGVHHDTTLLLCMAIQCYHGAPPCHLQWCTMWYYHTQKTTW